MLYTVFFTYLSRHGLCDLGHGNVFLFPVTIRLNSDEARLFTA